VRCADVLPLVTRHLDPLTALELGDFVHLGLGDAHGAVLVVGTKDQIYDIDFWVNDKDGTLSVEQTKVHKVPELKDGQWVEVPRYDWKDLGDSHVVP